MPELDLDGLASQMVRVARAGGDLEATLAAEAPELLQQLKRDAADPAPWAAWAIAKNRDENTQEIIVEPSILDWLLAYLGQVPSASRAGVAHAGVAHTYGYLFSRIVTPYGRKRDRWTEGVIGRGLGLPDGFLGPTPPHGTLLGNVSRVFREIAEAPIPRANAWRLEETFLHAGAPLCLQTDVVPLVAVQPLGTALLVYSVVPGAGAQLQLATGFPIAADRAAALRAPEGLGDQIPIEPRYNLHLEGFAALAAPPLGARSLVEGR